MDINDVVSLGKFSQSIMGTKGVCVLVVNDDTTCSNIVTEMLQHCNYQVLHIGGVLDVLNAIWETKDTLDLVLTNVHKLDSDGSVIIQHIQKKLNLPTILMCPDTRTIESKEQQFSFSAYVLNDLSRIDVNNLWQFALEKERGKMVAAFQDKHVGETSSMSNIEVEIRNSEISSSVFGEDSSGGKNEKREGSKEDQPVAKKPRVVWTSQMHQKFLQAIEIIGYDKVVPTKIVQVMDIPGLTRENVASHLQKFRGSMKRAQETSLISLTGKRGTKGFKGINGLSSPFVSRLNSLQMNMLQNSYMSAAKEAIFTQKPHLILTKNNDQFSFGTTWKNYTNFGGPRFNDPSGAVDKMQQKYTPDHQLHLAPDLRIYGDQMKNIIENISKNSSNCAEFVGYRLTSDGNSIQFGSRETISCPNLIGCVPDRQQICPPIQCDQSVPRVHGNDQNPTQWKPTSSVANTEECFSLLDQNDYFPCDDQDFLNKNSVALLDGVSEQRCSSPLHEFSLEQVVIEDNVVRGKGGTCEQFDWEDFEDTFFEHD